MALNENVKALVRYIAYLKVELPIYLACKAQIILLLLEKIIVPAEYLDFVNVLSKKFTIKLFKYFNIYEYTISLKLHKQPPYDLIYSLSLVKLKAVKIYKKINLANSFIGLFKFSARTLILFI